jgi:ketosteroid isomerase-like protein
MFRFVTALFVAVGTLVSFASAHTIAIDPIPLVSVDWAFDWMNKDLESVLSYYTDDAVFMDANGSRITGKPALRKFFATVLKQYSAHPVMHSVKYGSCGDLGYDWGDYTETVVPVADPSHAIQTKGTYLVILRKVSGHWMITSQMWTGTVPVPVKR